LESLALFGNFRNAQRAKVEKDEDVDTVVAVSVGAKEMCERPQVEPFRVRVRRRQPRVADDDDPLTSRIERPVIEGFLWEALAREEGLSMVVAVEEVLRPQ
jgi:hypothetical protein